MKDIPNNFLQELAKNGRQIDAIITYQENGNTITLDSDEIIAIKPIKKTQLLKSLMKECDIETSKPIPKNAEINVKIGLLINNEYNYINLGKFIVYNEPEYNADTLSYTLKTYDKMLYSMVDWKDMQITYPISVRDFINKICQKIGLTFKNINDEFANYDKMILVDSYTGYDYKIRDVLDELAQVTASIICINDKTDELEVRYPNQTNLTINEDFLKDVNIEIKEKFGPINTITLSRGAEADNVYIDDLSSVIANGVCEIKIKDNQIMNFNDRSDYLPDILEKLNGLNYYIMDIESTGIMLLDIYDLFNLSIEEQIYNCLLLNDELNIQDGISESIYNEIPEETQTDYSKADKTDRRINQVYIIADKADKKIEAVVSEVTDNSQKITQLTQDVDSISTKVENIADVTQVIKGTKKITIPDAVEGELLELHIDGNNTVFKHTYVSEETLVSDDTILQGDSLIKVYTRNICPTKVTDWENGYFAGTTGEKWDSLEYIRNKEKIKVEAGKRITFSLNHEGYLWTFVYFYDFANRYIGGIQTTNNQTKATITIPEKVSYINVMIKKNQTQEINPYEIIDIKPQIEYGEEKTDFIQFNTQIITLGINDVLRQKEDIKDTYDLQDSKSILTRRINKDDEILIEPKEEILEKPFIFLVTGENFIEIENYTANLSCKYAKQNEFTDIYATKVEVNSKIEQTAQEIQSQVNKKVDEQQMTSAISQTAEQINSEVSKKVGDDEIISKINQSAEEVQIDANKISLVGKEINLTGDNTIIKSNNLNVDKNGDLTCNNAKMTNVTVNGGKIKTQGSGTSSDLLRVESTDDSSFSYIQPRWSRICRDNGKNRYSS